MPSFEADVTVEFEVWCSCGAGLCNQCSTNGTSVTVEPCEKCLEKEHDDAYDEGKADGRSEAEEEKVDANV
jgi:hypothetical protein